MRFRAPGPKGDFSPMWPSSTSGDGRIRKNNRAPGDDQPNARPRNKLKVSCKNCGFMTDLSENDHSGGSLSGDGAGGSFSTHSSDPTRVKEQAYRAGGGCSFCFSKNFSSRKRTA